jgi:hypothetical protein
MTELFLFGASHTLQCGHESCAPASIAMFRDEMVRVCKQESIKRIAEEMSAEGLARHNATATVGTLVAADLGICHQNIDLTNAEKVALSIDDTPVLATVERFHAGDGGSGFREAMDDLADAVRERIWIARLLAKAHWPALFICGSDHVQSVRRIFRSVGLDSKVVHRDFGPSCCMPRCQDQRI